MNTLNRRMFMQQGGVVPSQTRLPPAQMMDPQMMDPSMMDPSMMDPSMLPPGATQQVVGNLMEQEGAALTDGIMSQVDSAQDYEELMNAIRGNELPIGDRRRELAELVGAPDAEQTPDSVLTLVQPTLSLVDAQGGLDSLMQEQANIAMEDGTGAPTPMAGGLGSMLMAGQPEEPVQMAYGGLVRKMANGTTGNTYFDGPVPTFDEPASAPRSLVDLYSDKYEALGPIFGELMGDPDELERRKKGSLGNLQLKFAADVLSGLYTPTAAPVGFLGRIAPAAGAFAENLGTLSVEEQARADKMKAARLQLTTAEVADQRAVEAALLANKRAAAAALLENQRAVEASLLENKWAVEAARLLAKAKKEEPVSITDGTDLVSQTGERIYRNPKVLSAADQAASNNFDPNTAPKVLAEFTALMERNPEEAVKLMTTPTSNIAMVLGIPDIAAQIPSRLSVAVRNLDPNLRSQISGQRQLLFSSIPASEIENAKKAGRDQAMGGNSEKIGEYQKEINNLRETYTSDLDKINTEYLNDVPGKERAIAALNKKTETAVGELRKYKTGNDPITDYQAASGFYSMFRGAGQTTAENILGGFFKKTGVMPDLNYNKNAEAETAFKVLGRDMKTFFKSALQAGTGDRLLKNELDDIDTMVSLGTVSRFSRGDQRTALQLKVLRRQVLLTGADARAQLEGNIYEKSEKYNALKNTIVSSEKLAENLRVVIASLEHGGKPSGDPGKVLFPFIPLQ
jgi:hypothetical protein